MEQHTVKIINIKDVTHNVRSYRVEKPSGYKFEPGQATEISINTNEWTEEKRPFTFTGLNEYPYLEFTIKSYHDHDGVTNALYKLKEGDELIIRDVWGAISYKSPGYFIAGGAGITPFIAILRQLYKDNKIGGNELFFSNKKEEDIIRHAELDKILGNKAHYILTQENNDAFMKGPVNKYFLQREIRDFSKAFYVCGPDEMVKQLTDTLKELGATPDSVVFEK